MIDSTEHNHAPQYTYQCRRCQTTIDIPVRETIFWSCPSCKLDESLPHKDSNIPMYRVYHVPNMSKVWTGHLDMTSGEYVTDYKKMRETWRRKDDELSYRLGATQTTIEVDPSDRASIGITEQGLNSTHDAHVATGEVKSKGKFVFPMKGE